MYRTKIAIFLTAVGLIGVAPLLLGAAYLARRRAERGTERMSRSFLPTVAVVTILLLAVGGFLAWTLPPSGGSSAAGAAHPAIPMQLGGEMLTSYVDGPDAIDAVIRLHGSTFPMTDAQIATYGDGLATIWRSGTPDAATAARQVERMREGIAGGGSPFSTPRPVRGHPEVYATFGLGQKHFFFARGASVWWVAAEPTVAGRALSEVLRVST